MKKKELTLQDIFNQNNELYKNIIDCLVKLEAKIDGQPVVNNDISNADYVTITADDVLVGGKPSRQYNGQDIYNYYHLPAYFKEIRDILMQKKEIRLLEIHCLQSSTDGEYAKTGNPTPDKNGCNVWCCVVWEDNHRNKTIGPWVFNPTDSSAADCASYCANYCAYSVRDFASFRSAVLGLSKI